MFAALCSCLLVEVEAVEVHYFGPGGYEVFGEGFFGVGGGVDLGDGSELGVAAED
jgi:hypothetical protein